MALVDFDPKYDSREVTDGSFINRKKIYEEKIYVIVPYNTKHIAFKSSEIFSCFLRKKGEIYGDALIVTDIPEVKEVLFYSGDKVVNKLNLEVLNVKSCELSCNLDKWTFPQKGVYRIKFNFDGMIIDDGFEIVVK